MKKIRTFIINFMAVLGIVSFSLVAPVFAQESGGDCKPADCIKGGLDSVGGDKTDDKALENGIKNVVNVLLFILGAIAVIMIIIGGIRYTTSNGDASNIKSAKDTILYAVVGLVVAILAYAIVNFVVDAFGGSK